MVIAVVVGIGVPVFEFSDVGTYPEYECLTKDRQLKDDASRTRNMCRHEM